MKALRKTKIVCTLGPTAGDPTILREMMLRGMNCARLNFSHGSHEEHLERANMIKSLRAELGLQVALMMDTKGPEIRTKTSTTGSLSLEKGKSFTLFCSDHEGDINGVSITYQNLFREISTNTRILIDDGLIELLVLEVVDDEIRCVIVNGGTLGNNKSINLPGVSINLPSITPRDEDDIAFAAREDFDLIAASFVRKASDVHSIRRVLEAHGGESVRIISKIENQEGVANIDEIVEASDGIMVARGDLGVEIPAEDVPMVQKMLIQKCVAKGKPVITATQMLDSMMRNPRPTRAEVNDVANAVFDGTSCVMLSGETASGKYPLEAISTMVRIAERAEKAQAYAPRYKTDTEPEASIPDAISYASHRAAKSLNAKAIISVTTSGDTARLISRFRPDCPIIAVSPNPKTLRQLAVSWGVLPCYGEETDSADELFQIGTEAAKATGLVQSGDTVIITSGVPVGVQGSTNLIKAQQL